MYSKYARVMKIVAGFLLTAWLPVFFLAVACEKIPPEGTPKPVVPPTTSLESRGIDTDYIFDKDLDMCFVRQSVVVGNYSDRTYGKGFLAHVPCSAKFMRKVKNHKQ